MRQTDSEIYSSFNNWMLSNKFYKVEPGVEIKIQSPNFHNDGEYYFRDIIIVSIMGTVIT